MIALTYVTYLSLTAAITILTAVSLRRRGRQFVVDAFEGDERRGGAFAELSLVTFYLISLGVIALLMRWGKHPRDVIHAVEQLSVKVGLVLIVLGIFHSLKVRRFAALRRKTLEARKEIPS